MADPAASPLGAIEGTVFSAPAGTVFGAPIWIYQGDFYVTSRDDVFLATVLGSCVAVCMRDPVAGCGGMNHFLLPDAEDRQDDFPSAALRFGSYSIERLINSILSHGGRRGRLETKVFGGASVTAGLSDVGARNVDFIEHYLAKERLPIASADLRGKSPRRLRYFPSTGRAFVALIDPSDAVAAIREELRLLKNAKLPESTGSMEIFVDRD